MPLSPRKKTPRKTNKPKKVMQHGLCSPPSTPPALPRNPPTPRMAPAKAKPKYTSPPRPPKNVDLLSSSPINPKRSPSGFIFIKYLESAGKLTCCSRIPLEI